jgi:hypothetical protein
VNFQLVYHPWPVRVHRRRPDVPLRVQKIAGAAHHRVHRGLGVVGAPKDGHGAPVAAVAERDLGRQQVVEPVEARRDGGPLHHAGHGGVAVVVQGQVVAEDVDAAEGPGGVARGGAFVAGDDDVPGLVQPVVLVHGEDLDLAGHCCRGRHRRESMRLELVNEPWDQAYQQGFSAYTHGDCLD